LWAALGDGAICELDDELAVAGSMRAAICEGLRTIELPPRSVHVLSSDWQPSVPRPQVNVLLLPSSAQGVIAIPAPGLSVTTIYISQHPHP